MEPDQSIDKLDDATYFQVTAERQYRENLALFWGLIVLEHLVIAIGVLGWIVGGLKINPPSLFEFGALLICLPLFVYLLFRRSERRGRRLAHSRKTK